MPRYAGLVRWEARFGAVILVLSAATALGSGTLDVACAPGASGGFLIFGNGNGNNLRWAPVFTAGRSGKLLTVGFASLSRHSGGSGGDIAVELHPVDGSGTPTDPVLASTALPNADIPLDTSFNPLIDFAPTSAFHLTQGQKYAIVIATADTAQNDWTTGGGDPCPGIELFQQFFGVWSQFTVGVDAGFAIYLGPANDDFARAEMLAGQNPSATGTTAGGTRQDPGEPDHYTIGPSDIDTWMGDHTVWYRWTAVGSGPTTIDTCAANIDSILAVYTGADLTTLVRVTDNNNACPSGYGSKVTFAASAGTSYAIAVGDAGGARETTFTLAIAGAPPPTTTSTTSTTSTTLPSPTSTTSTTLPGCGEGATYGSVTCRLGELLTRLDAAPDLGRLKGGLLNAATKARTKEGQAEGFVGTGKTKQEKKSMKKAVKALSTFLHKVRSRSARKLIPPTTRQSLIDRTNPVLADMKTLLGTL